MSETQAQIHNRVAMDVVKQIIGEPVLRNGHYTNALIILESVIVGVIAGCIKMGGDDVVLDSMIVNAKKRLKEVPRDGKQSRAAIRAMEGMKMKKN